jgi:hypothetical protein
MTWSRRRPRGPEGLRRRRAIGVAALLSTSAPLLPAAPPVPAGSSASPSVPAAPSPTDHDAPPPAPSGSAAPSPAAKGPVAPPTTAAQFGSVAPPEVEEDSSAKVEESRPTRTMAASRDDAPKDGTVAVGLVRGPADAYGNGPSSAWAASGSDGEHHAEPPTARYHDGFYLRLSLGVGYFSTGLESQGLSFAISGASAGFDAMIGGTPAPGFVVGGAYFFERAPSPSASSGSNSGTLQYDLNFGTLGVFVDGFPDPHGGFHLGGTFGFSFATLSSSDGGADAKSTGYGGGAFLGYDGWVAEQWAVGCFTRVIAASLSDTTAGVHETLSPWSFQVMVSLLHH